MLILLTTALIDCSVAANMNHHFPPPHNLLHIRAHLENQQLLNFTSDVHQQLRNLIVVRYPIILIVDNLICQHS